MFFFSVKKLHPIPFSKLLVVSLLVGFFAYQINPVFSQGNQTLDIVSGAVLGGGGGEEFIPGPKATNVDEVGIDEAVKGGKDTNTKTDGKSKGGPGPAPNLPITECSWGLADLQCIILTGLAAPAIILLYIDLGLLWLTSWLLELFIQFDVLHKTVVALWAIVRDIVNIGFVIAMIVIACATMFSITSHAYKQTLLKLIIGALLINFSLVFIGFFLDMNNIASTFMLKQISGSSQPGEKQTALENIIYGMSGSDIITKDGGPKITKDTPLHIATWTKLAEVYIKSLFLFIMASVFGVMLVAMLVRIGHLVYLIIQSPIIWLQNVFEFSRGGFKTWWEEFFMWCFLSTFILFNFYISVIIYAYTAQTWLTGQYNPILGIMITAIGAGIPMAIGITKAFEHSQGAGALAVNLAGGAGKRIGGALAKRAGMGRLASLGQGLINKGIQRGGVLGGVQKFTGKALTQAGGGVKKAID